MNTLVKTAGILSWINLIIGSLLVLGGLLGMMASPNGMMVLVSVVLTGSIVLHSYASLQLRKSILDEQQPLSSQTITGIRLVGFMALFFAILNIANAVVITQNAEEVSRQAAANLSIDLKGFNLTALIKGLGIFFLLFSVGIAVNVFISVRLLRSYLASRDPQP